MIMKKGVRPHPKLTFRIVLKHQMRLCLLSVHLRVVAQLVVSTSIRKKLNILWRMVDNERSKVSAQDEANRAQEQVRQLR